MFEFRSLRFARAIVRVCSFIFVCEIADLSVAQFNDPNADQEVLPTVPPGFEVSLFEREPLVRHPCSMAFDQQGRLIFGGQEEMGFGIHGATPLSKKNGGVITNSSGLTIPKATWGLAAQLSDDSGKRENQPVGITLLTHPENFRESWWHNRDYGILVANPFGRYAMKQGDPSSIRVGRDKPLRIVFGTMIHSGSAYVRSSRITSSLMPSVSSSRSES